MVIISKTVIVFFGLFLIMVGLLMLINPEKARSWLEKAGSTNFINYAEITIRMIPAAAMIIYSEYSRFPEALFYIGGFMIFTSFVLYLVPRNLHHNFALKSAEKLTSTRIRLLSPLALTMGLLLIYSVY